MGDEDKFEEEEMMKGRPFANSIWYNFLFNHILKPIIKKTVRGAKGKNFESF